MNILSWILALIHYVYIILFQSISLTLYVCFCISAWDAWLLGSDQAERLCSYRGKIFYLLTYGCYMSYITRIFNWQIHLYRDFI